MELIDSANNNVNFNVVDMDDQDSFYEKENKGKTLSKGTQVENEDQYFKELLLVNYQRYRALFHSMLINSILVDDRYVIRDINKKAKEEFGEIIGANLKIGTSLTSLFYGAGLETVLERLRKNNTLGDIIEFDLIDPKGIKHQFKMEPILFISPNDNVLFKCISIVKT
ncbi:MAG TPA: hypothetical protein VNW06_05680, partial [Cytophagaceae bacterium]|nr:hypothetical protein [Cytophagaceae bacterium]